MTPLGCEVYAEAGHHRRVILQTHGGQVQAVRRHEVRRLRQVLGSFDKVTRADDVRVRVVYGHVEAERLQEHVLVEHQVLGLLLVVVRSRIKRGAALATVQADVRHFDHVFQLPGLLLHLCGEEERCRRHRVPVELRERVECIKTMHVHDGRVDT